MTVAGYLRERPAPAQPETDEVPRWTVLAARATRVPWCWPALLTPAQAALLRPRYRVSEVRHAPSLTVFLLVRQG